MAGITFKRKLYQNLLDWKRNRSGRTAVLVEGARRIGKSTLVEAFAKQEYRSYILVDFSMRYSICSTIYQILIIFS